MVEAMGGGNGGNAGGPRVFTFGGGSPMGFFGLHDLSQMMNGIGLAGNPGDYAWGNQFDQILHNLFHQSGPKGPPPADETAVRELPKEEIGPADVDAKEDCPVCKEEYKLGEQVMKLPCNHRFHIDCLQPWLKMRNTVRQCFCSPNRLTSFSSALCVDMLYLPAGQMQTRRRLLLRQLQIREQHPQHRRLSAMCLRPPISQMRMMKIATTTEIHRRRQRRRVEKRPTTTCISKNTAACI